MRTRALNFNLISFWEHMNFAFKRWMAITNLVNPKVRLSKKVFFLNNTLASFLSNSLLPYSLSFSWEHLYNRTLYPCDRPYSLHPSILPICPSVYLIIWYNHQITQLFIYLYVYLFNCLTLHLYLSIFYLFFFSF